MAEDSIKSTLRPVWRLGIAMAGGLALAVLMMAWPAIVQSGPPPLITQVEVTSSESTYFYSPPLADTGGTVYFNSLDGEGAGQMVTVTVTVSDTDPIRFDGGTAFGSTPFTMVPITQSDTTSTWSVAYTIGVDDASEPGVVFTVTDSLSATDTISINFIQDNDPPGITSRSISEGSPYLYADDTTIYYGDDMSGAVVFTVKGEAEDSGSGLKKATFSVAFNGTPGDDDDFSDGWAGPYNPTSANWGNGDIWVTIYDKVGNSALQPFHYERDISNPVITDTSISETSPYLHAVGTGVYYSDQMGPSPEIFSVQGNASDTGSGYHRVTFSSAFGPTPPADTNSPWQGEYSVTSTDYGNGSIVATAFDNVGNSVSTTFVYTEDITPPVVSIDNVTDPGYDFVPGELDDDGSNWYAAGDLTPTWSFTSTTSDSGSGLASGACTWDHQSDPGFYQSLDCGPDGSGSFSGVAGDPDGTVTVTVTISDHVGNTGSDSVVLNIDETPPAITNPSIDDQGSPYLHVVGTTVYYGDDMSSSQAFTVQGNASDSGVGLGSHSTSAVTFSAALNDNPLNEGTPSQWQGDYTARSWDIESGVITVTVYDLLGNNSTQTFNYVRDTGDPSSNATSPQYDNGGTIPVDWTASDTGSSGMGLTALWYKKGSGGSWSASGLTQSGVSGTFQFTPDGDQVYYFATRATDNVRNQEDEPVPPTGEGDTSTIFDTAQPVVNASPIQESSPYLHVTGTTLYYGNKMTSAQSFTLAGTASDPNPGTGSGLERATFSPAFGDTPPDVSTPATWSGVYDVASTDTGNGTISVAISDYAGNTTSKVFSYVRDVLSPSISVHATYNQDQNAFDVYWGGSTDAGAGIANYSVEYCLGDQEADCGESGTWLPWLNNLPATTTSSSFGPSSPASLDPDKIYRFRVTATDRVNNDGFGLSNIVKVGIRYVYLATIFNNNDPTVPSFISGDFETGTFAGWKTGGVLPSSIEEHPVWPTGGTPPNGKTYAALLGSPDYGSGCSSPSVPAGQAYIKAYVPVPTGGTPYLRFDYRVRSYDWMETLQGQPWERLEVQIDGTTMGRYGNPNKWDLKQCKPYDSGWNQAEFDLSAYAGRTILLTLFVVNQEEPPDVPNVPEGMSYYNTYSYVDNVRIEVGP